MFQWIRWLMNGGRFDRFEEINHHSIMDQAMNRLQVIYAVIVFASVAVFSIQTCLVDPASSLLRLIPNIASLTPKNRLILTCSLVQCWCGFYSLTMAYLIGYRSSVSASISHCSLVGSYWIISILYKAEEMLIPLSLYDQLLVPVQLILGSVFVIRKRQLHWSAPPPLLAELNDQPHTSPLEPFGYLIPWPFPVVFLRKLSQLIN